jgi:hypothetical protein
MEMDRRRSVAMKVGRITLLITALAALAVGLIACTAVPSVSSVSNVPNSITFSTPDSAQNTPTPTFPVFTIGAWPSNFSPNINDAITFYVICRVQDPSMQTPPRPPSSPVHVHLVLGDPVNQTLDGITGTDGIAAIPYVVNDPAAGQPVVVTATADYPGGPWVATTFFTPGVGFVPTATPKGGHPTPTATP